VITDDLSPHAFAGQGLRVIGTHFGRIEDLRVDNTTNANTDQLGYTDAPIDLHTDQPFLDEPPRYQLLQSIRRAEVGGESAGRCTRGRASGEGAGCGGCISIAESGLARAAGSGRARTPQGRQERRLSSSPCGPAVGVAR
jgi:hypothetical protein